MFPAKIHLFKYKTKWVKHLLRGEGRKVLEGTSHKKKDNTCINILVLVANVFILLSIPHKTRKQRSSRKLELHSSENF